MLACVMTKSVTGAAVAPAVWGKHITLHLGCGTRSHEAVGSRACIGGLSADFHWGKHMGHLDVSVGSRRSVGMQVVARVSACCVLLTQYPQWAGTVVRRRAC
jgi:hypothetical protein